MEQKIEIAKKEYEDLKKAQERAKNQYKRQNEFISKNFDRVSLVLPQGTVARIRKITKESLNGYITNLILSDLENLEEILNCENPNFEDQEQPEEFSEPVPEVPEPIVEPQKEAPEPVEKVEEKPEITDKKPMTPEEFQEFLDGKREEAKRQKEEREQAKKDREAAEERERDEKIKADFERLKADWQGIRDEQQERQIKAILADPQAVEFLRDPGNKDRIISKVGEDFYKALIYADKEKQRKESIDRASAEMGASKPPF